MMVSNLAKKLRIKEGQVIAIINIPPGYLKLLHPLPPDVNIETDLNGKFDFIHLFVTYLTELEESLPRCKKALNKNGNIWISFPKKSSKIKTDLTKGSVWAILEKSGLSGPTLISIDETWSAFGLKNSEVKPKSISQIRDEDNIAKFVDSQKRTIRLPDDFNSELSRNKQAYEFYNGLSFTNRKEYIVWIVTSKKEETRKLRVIQSVEKLKAGVKNPFVK